MDSTEEAWKDSMEKNGEDHETTKSLLKGLE